MDLSNIVCHKCQKKRHYTSNCPNSSKTLCKPSKPNINFIEDVYQDNQEENSDLEKDLAVYMRNVLLLLKWKFYIPWQLTIILFLKEHEKITKNQKWIQNIKFFIVL